MTKSAYVNKASIITKRELDCRKLQRVLTVLSDFDRKADKTQPDKYKAMHTQK